MRNHNWRLLAALSMLVAGLTVASPGGAETLSGEELFNQRTCLTCHGKDGKTPILPAYPIIAGQSYEYIVQQMTDIKSGARSNANSASMRGVMHLVNDDEIKVLAEYVSKLPR